MGLSEKIENDFKAAMKERNTVKVSTLRMLKADMTRVLIDQNKKTLEDGDILKIVERQIKQHKESIEQFKKGSRQDLVDKETKELEILLGYMPEQLPEGEIKKAVAETIKELGATSKKDMGKVMKAVMEKVKGKADGKTVSQIVNTLLPE